MAGAPALTALGYEVRGLLDDPGTGAEKGGTLYLRADRVERHTVETLVARCQELEALAERLAIEGFDGMDVGAIDGP